MAKGISWLHAFCLSILSDQINNFQVIQIITRFQNNFKQKTSYSIVCSQSKFQMMMHNNIYSCFFKEFWGLTMQKGARELGHMPPLLLENNLETAEI